MNLSSTVDVNSVDVLMLPDIVLSSGPLISIGVNAVRKIYWGSFLNFLLLNKNTLFLDLLLSSWLLVLLRWLITSLWLHSLTNVQLPEASCAHLSDCETILVFLLGLRLSLGICVKFVVLLLIWLDSNVELSAVLLSVGSDHLFDGGLLWAGSVLDSLLKILLRRGYVLHKVGSVSKESLTDLSGRGDEVVEAGVAVHDVGLSKRC